VEAVEFDSLIVQNCTGRLIAGAPSSLRADYSLSIVVTKAVLENNKPGFNSLLLVSRNSKATLTDSVVTGTSAYN